MKTSLNGTRYVVGTTVFGLLLFGATAVHADVDENFDAHIEVLENLAVEEEDALDFGTVGRPTGDTAEFTLDAIAGSETDIQDGGEDDSAFTAGESNPGHYIVYGNPEQDPTVTATVDGNFGDGVDLVALWLDGTTDNEVNFDIEDDGSGDLYVGGEVHVDDDAAVQEHTAQINITASYE